MFIVLLSKLVPLATYILMHNYVRLIVKTLNLYFPLMYFKVIFINRISFTGQFETRYTIEKSYDVKYDVKKSK